ncbi:MAG: hypothetical protein KTR31_22035 [Myxococcales bacterium]|nr:hypothetical protein [Myxococcales bacterium]
MRHLALLLACLSACSGERESTTGACALAAELDACPDCSNGPTQCEFRSTIVVLESCGSCQAEHALLRQMCRDDEQATRQELEAELFCEAATCTVWYDDCSDPCLPLCQDSWVIPGSGCGTLCLTPTSPPGACVRNEFGCDWLEGTSDR